MSVPRSAYSETVSTTFVNVGAGSAAGLLHARTMAATAVAAASTTSEREGGMRCREDTAPRPSGSTHGGCLTSLVSIPSLAAVPTIREVVQALSRRSGVDAVLVVGRDGLPIDSHVANGVDGDSVAALLPSVISGMTQLGQA